MIRRCTVLITLGRSGQRDDLAWPPPLPRRASTDVQEVGSQPDERRRRIHDLPWASPGTDRTPAQSMLVPISTWEKLLAHAEDQLDLDLAVDSPAAPRRSPPVAERRGPRRSCGQRDGEGFRARAGLMRRATPGRYRLLAHPALPGDMAALAAYGLQARIAARTALDDLTYGRVTGKQLGTRHVSGEASRAGRVRCAPRMERFGRQVGCGTGSGPPRARASAPAPRGGRSLASPGGGTYGT